MQYIPTMARLFLSIARNLLFPSFCLHCNQKIDSSQLLCLTCVQLLNILPFDGRLLITFSTEIGPAKHLLHALKSGKAPLLAKGLAGFMGMQYLLCDLPQPEGIIPVPQSLFRSLQVGYNPSFLLAHHLGNILNAPVLSPLKRKYQHVRQTKVESQRRYRLSTESFQWSRRFIASNRWSCFKKDVSLSGKTLLLIDDLVGTGRTLQCCERRLSEGAPAKIIKMACFQDNISLQNTAPGIQAG